MKALNKLFIKPEQIKVEMIPGGELPHVGIQYIRKDALLEWAKDMKAETEDVIKQHPEDESLWAEMHWWEVVIAKINAM